MLRLLSSKEQDSKISENHQNPVMLVSIGFNHYSEFFTSFCIGQISHHQPKYWYNVYIVDLNLICII